MTVQRKKMQYGIYQHGNHLLEPFISNLPAMLLVLAVVYLSQRAINASPVSHFLRDNVPLDPTSPTLSLCSDQQRSMWDILWSCLATLFACTWVSVHPNIPPSEESWWKSSMRRFELMFWGLIAPEMIILWAMRQWYSAREIAKKYEGHGWTKTHAYFVQMGGFTLLEKGERPRVLFPEEMESLLRIGLIDLPQITEEEIRDRSKGDGLSKALVIGQTSWFVAQCVARHAQGLIVTELELVTGAFAALNGVMYFLWWNKPVDVRCSVPVPVHLSPTVNEPFKFKSIENPNIPYRIAIFSSICDLLQWSINSLILSWTWMWRLTKDLDTLNVLKATLIFRWTGVKCLVFVMKICFWRLSDIFLSWAVLKDEIEKLHHRQRVPSSNVPTFYAGTEYNETSRYLIASITAGLAALFGAVHCSAWFLSFPTYIELIIWRICSSVVAIIPLFMLLSFIIHFWAKSRPTDNLIQNVALMLRIVSYFNLPIYFLARVLLLGEAFATLRYLPPPALEVVDWVAFLPHI
ncbi:hypothetical protein GALMADRAFT_434880 [Galerina marginata CBS 339.88]|uniref:Uncharacterized protein n=1 Tax=Galerina marginata (strain CBS 339.88) TaxID=685588 RepID=A0A067T217_GALM3|nr:hypothetical protein GALMADRAFT_434880 [Galerina marginata CBS 339.88]